MSIPTKVYVVPATRPFPQSRYDRGTRAQALEEPILDAMLGGESLCIELIDCINQDVSLLGDCDMDSGGRKPIRIKGEYECLRVMLVIP